MKLSQIYERNIERNIDSAVTVSNRNAETVDTEIKEYVFTKELTEKLYTFLHNVMHRKTNRTGIWINGYYGSGKSHFIKYIDYCLSAPTREQAFEHFIQASKEMDADFSDATPSNISNLKTYIEKNEVETITFNVEDETDDGSGERLTRIFINMLNRHRGYNSDNIPLAILLEKELDKKGVFEAFKQALKDEHGFHWEGNEQNYAGFALETVLETAKKVAPSLDTQSLYNRINDPETYKVGIKSTLISELKDYLKDKEKTFRLLFLVDEISQYIGKNKEVLLNFQNIIERVSEDLENKVWIACTAQQTLDDVTHGVGSDDAKDEFGKILGRFPAEFRVSLESSDPAFITQKRVLDKNAQGRIAVETLYRTNTDAIESQFRMHHELYKGYANEEEFVLAYPFVPYQFRLIADVFDAFQSLQFVIKEVKNNERSVLGITHFTAKNKAEQEVGYIVPFDAFFNNQFKTNLTHRGRRAMSAASDLPYVKNNTFAERVVNALFMISNLSENVRQTFPSTIDNLTLLLMDGIDVNKLELQKKIKEVLDRLIDESIIREENHNYFFFNEDEMDVKMQIKNTHLNFEDRLEHFDFLFRPLLSLSQRVHFGQNDFRMIYKVEEKVFLMNGDFTVKVLLMDKQKAEDKIFGNTDSSLLLCVNEWFMSDETLAKEFEQYAKTEKYLRHNGDSAQGTREQTLNNFRSRNATLKERIVEKLTRRFPETRFVSGQQIIDPTEVQGTRPAERFKNIVLRHLKNYYKHNSLADSYIANGAELLKKLPHYKAQTTTDNSLSSAESLVNDHISGMGNTMSVEDIIKTFIKAPYGWKDVQIIHILAMLHRKKVREFEYRNQPRFPLDNFVRKALVTSERQVLIVKQGEAIPAETLEAARNSFRDIFNKEPVTHSDGNELFEKMLGEITVFRQDTSKLAENNHKYPFRLVFKRFHEQLEQLETIRDPKRFFEMLAIRKDELKAASDQSKQLEGFLERALPEYEKMKLFFDQNTENLHALSQENKEKIAWLREFFEKEDPTADFRSARKTADELKTALNKLLKDLSETAEATYQKVFDELEAEAGKRGVDVASFATRSHKLDNLKRLKTVSSLKLAINDAGNFKTEQLSKILHEENRAKKGSHDKVEEPPVRYKPGKGYKTSVISNEEELNDYLSKVKDDMEKILKDGKKIILE